MDLFSIVLLACTAPYFVLPILVWRNMRLEPKPKLREISFYFFQDAVQKACAPFHDALTHLGFHHSLDASTIEPFDFRSFRRLYFLGSQHIGAIVTSFLFQDKDPEIFLEFVSRLENGSTVATHNNHLGDDPIFSRRQIVNSFASLKPHELFRTHQAALKLQQKKGLNVVALGSNGFAFLSQYAQAELLEQEDIGGLWLDAEGCYRPTLAYAVLATWYNMWPLKTLRRIFSQRKARIWLKEYSQ